MLKRFCIALCFILMIPHCPVLAMSGISAASVAVTDAYTGRVLLSDNSNAQRPIASTTKLMTCLIACETGDMREVVTVTDEMLYGTEGSLIYIKAGDRLTMLDLVKGAMLASGNDAANAIAVHIGGSVTAFADMMNRRAAQIGMKNTHFETPSGLDKGNHRSTAYDMALLAGEVVKNEKLLQIASMTAAQITVGGKVQTVYNHNKLLSYDKNFIGLKTGYTKKAGRCLVSAYKYGDSIIITVTLSAPNDWDDHKRLVNVAKKCYKHIGKTETVTISAVGANKNTVNAQYEYNIATVDDIYVKEYYYPFVYAPVTKGQVLGRADIYIANKLLKSTEIKASEGIKYGEQRSTTSEIHGRTGRGVTQKERRTD